ncbi:unnamed protein product [Withania somnifera]
MNPQQWAPPCNKQCTNKLNSQLSLKFLACDADGDTWEECLEQCDEMCYKSPVLKDQQWNCRHACVAGCDFKFDIPSEEVDKIQSSRSSKPPAEEELPDKNKST